ncbi:helix-turn-helix domain-containing protein [Micromonospora sp. NPDC005161]
MSDSIRYAGGAAAVKDALRASHDLKPTERLVLIAIVAHANAEGEAWPSIATVADYVGCSERTVQRALRRLVEVGRLVIRKAANIATRVYRLVIGEGDTTRREGDTTAREGDTQDVARSSSEDQSKKNHRAGARDWRRFLPKPKNPNTSARPYPYAERRGAALPPSRDTERCARHLGELAHNCRCCRSEALGGAA